MTTLSAALGMGYLLKWNSFAGGGQNVYLTTWQPCFYAPGPSEIRCWRQAPEGSVWEANFPPFPHSTQSKWGHLKECSLKNKPNIFSISNEKCLYTTYWNFSLWPQARKFRPPMSPCLKSLGHSLFFGFCFKETWHFLSASLLLNDYGVASAEAWQN